LKESTEKQLAFIILDIVAIIAILGVVLLADISDQKEKNPLQKMILGNSILGDWISISPGSFSTMGAGKAMTIKTASETVTCKFTNSKQNQWCKAVRLEQGCTGTESCSFRISREKYDTRTSVTSSCGKSYDIRIDGRNEELTYDCYKSPEELDYVQSKLSAGSSKIFTVKGSEYEIKVTYLAGQQAKFGINGEITEVMYPDTVMKLADGSIFIMTDVSIGAGGQPLAGFIIVR